MEDLKVILKWDDENLGKAWMNLDNLKLCLFTETHTKEGLLTVEPLIKESDD